MLKEAPLGKNPDEVAEFFDYYGSFVETFSGAELSGLRLFVPTKDFDKVIPLFSDLIINPSLPENEFKILKKKYYSSIQNNMKKTKYVAMRGLNLELFGDKHQLGYFVQADDANNVKLESLNEFISEHYTSNNCQIQIAGQYDDNILNLLNKYFGNIRDGRFWKNKSILSQNKNVSGEKNKIKVYDFKDAVQSTIYGGTFIDIKSDEDLILMGILNTVFGGYFGSRLMKNIREDKGYTYGIGSFVTEYSDRTLLRVVSDVGVDVTKSAISEVYNEIDLLLSKPVPESELKLVKNYMMGELISSLDGVIPTSMVFEKLIPRSRTKDFIYQNIELINSIDSKTLHKFALDKLKPDEFTFVVAGKY
ncbi:MAG: hypothetical protein C0596_15095 [Marinilabiliales bacterium]|nr:MAG: hypothetical protein C0596_15095 [Marinilabiliales bacterium]